MIPLLDLTAQYKSIEAEAAKAVSNVLSGGQYILGPNVKAFEGEFAGFCGVKYAIGVASGTDALILALEACGVGSGDEVITSPYTFFATGEAISKLGAVPVFCDIDAKTYNLSPRLIERLVTSRTKAIVPVHLYGQVTGMDRISEVAKKYGLFVVEDACQAAGAAMRGKMAGSWGNAGCFSFFPSKNLGGCGDGGMVVTADEQLAGRVRKLRHHGTDKKYYHSLIGYNSRLDEIQAALLRVKLKLLDQWNEQRRKKAALYNQLFENTSIVTPAEAYGSRHVYHQYVIRHKQRDQIMLHLKKLNIGCAVYYPLPLHLQKVYRGLGYKAGSLPVAEAASLETLALPVYPELQDSQIEFIAQEVIKSLM